MKLTMREARRRVIIAIQQNELKQEPGVWNPHALGKFANRLLLHYFKIWISAGFDGDFAWAMTEKAEKLIVAVRDHLMLRGRAA